MTPTVRQPAREPSEAAVDAAIHAVIALGGWWNEQELTAALRAAYAIDFPAPDETHP